jgi:hypothetical protein
MPLAKARAFQRSFGADDSLVEAVDDQIDKFGPDEEALPLSLAADLFRLVRTMEA